MHPKNRPTGTTLEDSKVRFQIELEFVQCLANPHYLTCRPLLRFLITLSFLLTLQISYPYCLHLLDLLQSAEFRREIARAPVARFIDDQMLLHWQHYLRKRTLLIARHAQELEASSQTKPASAETVSASRTDLPLGPGTTQDNPSAITGLSR
ncbi:unnamed protein product [Protopolystoma xenopodis]|uniref:Mediator of RNA polymerase II transcription subunit 31 n=1 Tax=Protopolystoma xenopodis TaxID=117903 RepID=A0A448WIB2_9PLAT|nr:unnamed protein product [Protopolystoma xenopodis]